jgi:hypothetical protein
MGPNHSPNAMEWGPKQINDPFRDIVLLSVVLLDQISALVPRGGSWHWPIGMGPHGPIPRWGLDVLFVNGSVGPLGSQPRG